MTCLIVIRLGTLLLPIDYTKELNMKKKQEKERIKHDDDDDDN